MQAKYARPIRKGQKNDFRDAGSDYRGDAAPDNGLPVVVRGRGAPEAALRAELRSLPDIPQIDDLSLRDHLVAQHAARPGWREQFSLDASNVVRPGG